MKKLLLLGALAVTAFGGASAADFIASELDGRLIQFENNENAGSCLNVTGDWITTSPEKTNLSHTAWYAEYDASEDGVVLSHDGKFIGRMPVVNDGNFSSKHISAVSSKAEAGRYRLYPIEVDGVTVYGLACTRDTEGNLVEAIGQTGAYGNATGWWIQDGGAGTGTPVNRWGSGAPTSKWKYSFIDEVPVVVSQATGTNYNGGTSATDTGWGKLWKSDKDATVPEVHINVAYNNMKYVNGALCLAPGAGCDYTFTSADPLYYVVKVEFDFTSTDHTTTITADGVTLTASDEVQHFEIVRNYGEAASMHMAGGNHEINTTNFIVTLRKLPRAKVMETYLNLKDTYVGYTEYPEIWDAEVANSVVASFEEQLDAIFPTYVTTDDVTAANTLYEENKKQINATADGKTVSLRNFQHSDRYMSTGTHADGSLRAHTTDNPDDLNAVWILKFDKETGAFRLHNYLSEREIGHITADETPVPMEEEGVDGHLYDLTMTYHQDAHFTGHVVGFTDRAASGHTYLHCGGANTNHIPEGGNRIVKWNSPESSAASGWFISFVEIVNQMDALKSLEGQAVVISDVDNGTHLAAVSDSEGAYTQVGFSAALRPAAVWNIQVNTKTGKLTLKNLVTEKYANDLTSPLSAESNSTIKVDDVESMLDTWHIIPTAATPTEEDAKYSIKAISDEQKEEIIAQLHLLYGSIGNEPGLFVYENAEDNETSNQFADAIDGYNSEDNFDYEAAHSAFVFVESHALVLFDMKSIEGPALIQIAYTPYSYVTTWTGQWNGNNRLQDHNASDGSLACGNQDVTFVYDNGKLYSLASGLAVINNNNKPSMCGEEDLEANVNDAIAIDFCAVDKNELVTTDDGVAHHCYAVKVDGTDLTFGGSSGGGNYRVGGLGGITGAPATNYAYTVQYVKNLTIDVEEGGYKLWRTPVAVNFGGVENNGAYIVSVSGSEITTTAVDGSDTYGAGTMFILTQTVNLNVENGVAAGSVPTAGLGHHAKQAHTMKPGKVYLTIHADQTVAAPVTPEVQGVYRDAVYFDGEQKSVKMYVEMPTEETTKVLGAHEAVIEADQSEKESVLEHGGAMMLALGGSSDTTQLGEISAESTKVEGVYDLQGRKLAAPVKGINIVNGKKVLVK